MVGIAVDLGLWSGVIGSRPTPRSRQRGVRDLTHVGATLPLKRSYVYIGE